MEQSRELWGPLQMGICGGGGLLVCLLFLFAIVQLCRAKFFFLEPTDTFLFYFSFSLCLVTTSSHFLQVSLLWNLEHSLGLLLQLIFCFIFSLIVDTRKRIFLFLHLFYLAALLVLLLFLLQTLLESLLGSSAASQDWRCSGIFGLIIPGAAFLFSAILTAIALVATNRASASTTTTNSQAAADSNQNSFVADPSPPVKKSKRKQPQQLPGRRSKLKQQLTQLVQEYYASSRLELVRKKTEVLTLITLNVLSITVQFATTIVLIGIGTNYFQPVESQRDCAARFNFPLHWLVALNILRTLTAYTPLAIVFYHTFWKQRGMVRSDSQSSLDIMFSSSSNSQLYESLIQEDPHAHSDSSGEDLVDMAARRDQERHSGGTGEHRGRIMIAPHNRTLNISSEVSGEFMTTDQHGSSSDSDDPKFERPIARFPSERQEWQ